MKTKKLYKNSVHKPAHTSFYNRNNKSQINGKYSQIRFLVENLPVSFVKYVF